MSTSPEGSTLSNTEVFSVARFLDNEVVLVQEDGRSPKSEIYGRSLSTIYRLGRFMVGRAARLVILSPEASQARAEFYTSVEEGFGTDMELGGGLEVRDFDARRIIDGRVMSKDPTKAISSLTKAGLICATEKVKDEVAEDDFRFIPQLIRSKWDHQNALIVDSMARGETSYNTRIVISPFPEEAAEESGDDYWRAIGYVPHLRRGFVQLYHVTEDGLIAGSLSFDGSDKERLRELFGKYGVKIPGEEVTDNWLQYAITDTLSLEHAKALALEIADQAGDPEYVKDTNTVEVTNEYREIMDTVFNQSYVHICESLYRGFQTPEARSLIFELTDQAEYFNERYQEALYRMRANQHNFTDDDAVVLHELLVYSTIEMMRALYLGIEDGDDLDINADWLQSLSPAAFQSMLGGFGAEGARQGRGYAACGLEIFLGSNGSKEGPQHAFGLGLFEEDKFGRLKFKCTKGHWNERPRNKLIDKCKHHGCKGKVKC